MLGELGETLDLKMILQLWDRGVEKEKEAEYGRQEKKLPCPSRGILLWIRLDIVHLKTFLDWRWYFCAYFLFPGPKKKGKKKKKNSFCTPIVVVCNKNLLITVLDRTKLKQQNLCNSIWIMDPNQPLKPLLGINRCGRLGEAGFISGFHKHTYQQEHTCL